MPSGEDVHGASVVPYCPYLSEKKNIVLENGPFMDDLPITIVIFQFAMFV